MKEKFGRIKVIVCGTRTFNDYDLLKEKLDFYLSKADKSRVEIISGCAPGADTLAIRYAEENGYKVWRFPADWKLYGKQAGIIRNTQMADFASCCIAFWDGESKGTADMIKQAKDYNLDIRVVKVVIPEPEIPPQPFRGVI